MYWILWDILIPLLLTFGLGVLFSWMWWRNNRSVSTAEGVTLAANITLINERDKVASELADVKQQLEELSAAGSLSEESSQDGDDLSTNVPGADVTATTGLKSEQSQQVELARATCELETVKQTLDAERRAKREVALELLNANNRLEKLGGENAQVDEKPDNNVVGWKVPEKKPAKKDRDELTQIKGVGPALEKLLHKAGIYHFEQLAKLDRSGVDELQDMLTGFPGRIRRDKWINQARQLQKKKYGVSSAAG